MAAFSTIFSGLSAAAGAGGMLRGLFGGGRGNNEVSQISTMENLIRQQQMNLEATRRTRDVIRNAQQATAQSEATAYSQGAGNSSSMEGVRGSIAGTAGTNIQGIEWNRELSNAMFTLNNARGEALQRKSASDASFFGQQGFLNSLSKSAGGIGRLADLGWGSVSNFFSGGSTGWNQNNDIDQVGSPT